MSYTQHTMLSIDLPKKLHRQLLDQPTGIHLGPPSDIMTQLQQYGLQPTGSKEGDLAAIAEAQAQIQILQDLDSDDHLNASAANGYQTSFLEPDTIEEFMVNNNLSEDLPEE